MNLLQLTEELKEQENYLLDSLENKENEEIITLKNQYLLIEEINQKGYITL